MEDDLYPDIPAEIIGVYPDKNQPVQSIEEPGGDEINTLVAAEAISNGDIFNRKNIEPTINNPPPVITSV